MGRWVCSRVAAGIRLREGQIDQGAPAASRFASTRSIATIAAGDRLHLTLSTADTPHLTPLPQQLLQLAGGVYTIGHSAAAPSSLTLELRG